MASVSQFAQYLLKHDLQRDPARQTFHNFLRNILEPGLTFAPELIDDFHARVLQFDHWQAESPQLARVVRSDLEAFIVQHLPESEHGSWLKMRHADTLQVVPLRLFQDVEDLVVWEHESRRKAGDQIKLIRLSETQVMVLLLSPSGNLEVKVYPNLALVCGPRLKLMAPVTHLFYAHDLELMPHIRQTLEGSLLTTHAFHVNDEGVHGLITRGYTFQKFETYVRAKLTETQDLFHALKKLERHFINPQTDPFYQDLISRLERANRLVGSGSPDTMAEAERVLNRARSTLKNIFPNDRLLTLLITHLEYGISQRRSGAKSPQPTQ